MPIETRREQTTTATQTRSGCRSPPSASMRPPRTLPPLAVHTTPDAPIGAGHAWRTTHGSEKGRRKRERSEAPTRGGMEGSARARARARAGNGATADSAGFTEARHRRAGRVCCGGGGSAAMARPSSESPRHRASYFFVVKATASARLLQHCSR
ncbi:hypothetical protein BD410DRAFT_371159 [Rickenella mellea]|uniref:Uncharacterized protein n=1 Tax=Rickenella mellea TaxID=50990 RepID=A0A4Y7PYG7_9AGAM|nr:hypothetical protein BD410DRAFT_371159 [Rickenella mellea]